MLVYLKSYIFNMLLNPNVAALNYFDQTLTVTPIPNPIPNPNANPNPSPSP